jgi:SAM-dependent methyltransferase
MENGRALAERLAAGEIDICEVIAAPERFGEIGEAAKTTPLERLVASDPRIGDGELDAAAWGRVGLDPGASLAALDAGDREWLADLVRFWRGKPRNVDETIAPGDWIHERRPDQYYTTGRTTIRRVRLAQLQTRKDELHRILDFGSGYGRILRQFKAAYPEARLAACDILPEAVDFCAETFGAEPIYAADDPGDTQLAGEFDLIWVGSLFTHLTAPRWTNLLDLFEQVLEPGGLLLFSTQGRSIRDRIADRSWKDAYGRPIWVNWGVTEDELDRLVADYDRDGFGYLEWGALDRQYGISIATPAWVLGQLQRRPGFEIVSYWERGWKPQDLVVCVGTRPATT